MDILALHLNGRLKVITKVKKKINQSGAYLQSTTTHKVIAQNGWPQSCVMGHTTCTDRQKAAYFTPKDRRLIAAASRLHARDATQQPLAMSLCRLLGVLRHWQLTAHNSQLTTQFLLANLSYLPALPTSMPPWSFGLICASFGLFSAFSQRFCSLLGKISILRCGLRPPFFS